MLVFGEPEAKQMGYAQAPMLPSYNLQSVVEVESGLIIHQEVYNVAYDSHLLHPMVVAAKEVLEVEEIQVLTGGGYSNAGEVARCEAEANTVIGANQARYNEHRALPPDAVHLRRSM